MILQKILFPDSTICECNELYFHIKNSKMSADTYFNSFSLGKWKKYTNLCSLTLVLQIKGKMKVEVSYLERQGTKVKKQCLLTTEIRKETNYITIPEKIFNNNFGGMISFSLERQTSDAELLGGWYEGECVGKVKNCHLAIEIGRASCRERV